MKTILNESKVLKNNKKENQKEQSSKLQEVLPIRNGSNSPMCLLSSHFWERSSGQTGPLEKIRQLAFLLAMKVSKFFHFSFNNN